MLLQIRLRFRQVCIIAIGVLSLYYFTFGALPLTSLRVPIDSNSAASLENAAFNPVLQAAYHEFSQALIKLLKENRPPTDALTKTDVAGVIRFTDHQKESLKRLDLVPLKPSEVELMRQAHQNVVRQAANISLPYVAGTRGIVSTAGGSNLPVFIISLRMLRRTGTDLPVELFLRADEEHGQYLCDDLLPSLNARCVIFDEFLKYKNADAIELEKYQYKIFSILYSSFEEVFFLDADNFPVQSPDFVFDSELFASKGLVTWPDFWISTASPRFYEIQETAMPPTNLRASTESGQIFVSKRTHGSALLVATYYNDYGPSHYYPLLTQGGPGEGDKETFLAGAAAVKAPFYQVSEPVAILGYVEDGVQHGVAMLQHDPVEDYTGLKSPKPFTIHANFPKMEPNDLFGSESPVVDRKTGRHHRLWGDKSATIKKFGRDVERDLWAEIRTMACDLGGVFADWKVLPSSRESKGTCDLVEEHIYEIFSSEKS